MLHQAAILAARQLTALRTHGLRRSCACSSTTAVCADLRRHAKAGAAVATQLRALVLLAALRWFSAVPAWYGRWSPAEAR